MQQEPRSPRSPRSQARLLFRDAILDAAEEEFAASGFHGARVQDIAKRAGVAVGTLYNHFETKEEALYQLLEARMGELAAALAPATSEREPGRWVDKLVARLTRLVEYKDKHVAFFLLAIEHGLLGDATGAAAALLGSRPLPHRARFDRAVLALVDEGMAEAAIAPGDRELYAEFLKSTLRAVARWARGKGSVPARDTAAKTVALFLGGAGARRRRNAETRRT